MFLRLCELILTIFSNCLILLKNKDVTKSSTDRNDLQTILAELRRIEEDKKKTLQLSEKDVQNEMQVEVRELNKRLKTIEDILFEKRSNLLKEKIVGSNSKENDK